MTAVISSCGRYRYALGRNLPQSLEAGPNAFETCLFVMLNPSTADANQDDPTIRRCIGFAEAWGYGRLEVGNLFAQRTPHPRELGRGIDPVGPKNDELLEDLARHAKLTIAAWGAHPGVDDRARAVVELLGRHSAVHCLGLTATGAPRHPLYVKADTSHEPYVLEQAA